MNLNKFAQEVHENAVEHGWWDVDPSFGEVIALCHSELSEALEEYRKGNHTLWYKCSANAADDALDGVVTICGICGKEGIDIEGIIRLKHEYNKTRPYLHGGKLL